MFSNYVGIMESNEVEVLAICEALPIFCCSFHGFLEVKSDSSNATSWVSLMDKGPWGFHFLIKGY